MKFFIKGSMCKKTVGSALVLQRVANADLTCHRIAQPMSVARWFSIALPMLACHRIAVLSHSLCQ